MPRLNPYKWMLLALLVGLLWLGIRYVLPVAVPFLLGLLLALAAEPMTGLLCRRCRFPRPLGAFVSVSATLALVLALLTLLAALLLREAGLLANALPRLGQNALTATQELLLSLAANAPDALRPGLDKTIRELFGSGSALMGRLLGQLPAAATALLKNVPGSALTLGTGLLSAYMIASRLPALREGLRTRLPKVFYSRVLPGLQRLKTVLFCWLKAQLRLSGISFLLLGLGFLLLGVPYAPVVAAVTAVVDALPVLGCGTVLLPWALVCLLGKNIFLGVGLLALYAAAALVRSALEPRLLGKQLGLDPLVTLIALYAGFKLWGFAGMLLSPLLATAATELAAETQK